jgi:ribosomal protein L21
VLQEAALPSLHEEEAPTDPGALSTNPSLVGNAEQLQAVIAIIKGVEIFVMKACSSKAKSKRQGHRMPVSS